MAAPEIIIRITDAKPYVNKFLGLQFDLLAINIANNGINQSQVELLDAKTGKKLVTLRKPLEQTEKFSLPTGAAILAVLDDLSRNGTNFSIYDLKTGQQLYCFCDHAFNFDGSQMATLESTGIMEKMIVILDLHLVAKTTPTIQP